MFIVYLVAKQFDYFILPACLYFLIHVRHRNLHQNPVCGDRINGYMVGLIISITGPSVFISVLEIVQLMGSMVLASLPTRVCQPCIYHFANCLISCTFITHYILLVVGVFFCLY